MQPKLLAHSSRRKAKTISTANIRDGNVKLKDKNMPASENTKDVKSNTELSQQVC